MKPGDRVLNGRYVVVGMPKEGSYGYVAQVREVGSDRIRAIKELKSHLASDPVCRERFRHEAMLGQKGVRGVVRVFEHAYGPSTVSVSPGANTCFMVMEYLPGGTLQDRIARGPLPWKEAARIGGQIGLALRDLQERARAIHRDIKPENILIDAWGRPVLGDLGNSHLFDGMRATRGGQFVGSPAYAPPEQAEYRAADMGAWSDIYALAATMYEMGTGVYPHASLPGFFGSPADQVRAIATEMPVPPSHLSPGIPPALERLLMKNLAKDPKDRHQNMREFLRDLCLAMGWLDLTLLQVGGAAVGRLGRGLARMAPAVGRWAAVGAFMALVMSVGPGLVQKGPTGNPVTTGAVAATAARVAPPPPPVPPSSPPVVTSPPPPAASPDPTIGISIAAPDPDAGEVRGTRVRLRSAPVLDPDNILTTLDEPHPVRLLGYEEGWYRVATTVRGVDLEGYIFAGLVRPEVPGSGIALGECRADGVLLRQGPDTGYDPVGDRACHRGEKLLLVGETPDGDWFRLLLPDRNYAWICADFVEVGAR